MGSEFQVNTYTTSEQYNPTIAMDADGDFVISWTSDSQDGSSGGIYAQRYNRNGVAVGSEFQVNTYTDDYQGNPTIAMDADGDFVISWTSSGQDGSGTGIYAQRYDRNGVAVGSEFQVNTYTSDIQFGPTIAMDADGDFIISWESRYQDGGGSGGIYAQRYNSAGEAVGGELQVNTYTNNEQSNPAIAMDADGDFVISWTSDTQDGSGTGIYAQRYDRNGVAVGSEFRVNTYTDGNQGNPTIDMDAEGNFVISWTSFGQSWTSNSQDGSLGGIFAQRYDSNGMAVGSEFRVNTYTNGNQYGSTIAIDADGDFAISWVSDGQDGSSEGIFAQRFSASALVYNVINGTTASDNLTATAKPDRVFASSGNDTVKSTVANALQSDTFDGGAGIDTLVMRGGDASTALVLNVTDVSNQLSGIANLTVQNFEIFNFSNFNGSLKATGGAGNDRITGGRGNDWFDGGAGNNTLAGGRGNDTYIVSGGTNNIIEAAGNGIDLVQSSVSHTLAANVENLNLAGTANINGTGNSLRNLLIGNGGNNILDGQVSADTMTGGLGNDTYIVDNVADLVTENAEEGTDLVRSAIAYTLTDNVENLTLTGTSNLTGTGNSLNNLLRGNSGNNILDGKLGADTMTGGLGDDTYIVDNVGDIVNEGISQGIDRVLASVSYTLRGNAENLTLRGSANINGTGNSLNNIFLGNGGNNILDGKVGADTIAGGAGNDTLLGGMGDDLLTGGSGRDLLTGGSGRDRFIFNASSDRTDTITDFMAGEDILDIANIFNSIGVTSVNSNYLRFTQSGANTLVQIDLDGTTGGANFLTYATANNTLASDFAIGTNVIV